VHALQLTKFGEPLDSVSLVSRQTRQPAAGELLIEMHAAPLHPSDIHLIRGFYGLRPELPLDLGADGVGTVIEAGSAADRGLIGRRVIPIPTYRHGTWAERTVAKTHDTVVVDDHTDLVQLAMLGVIPVTAQLLLTVNLVRREAAAAEALAAGGHVAIIVDDDLGQRLQDALGDTELALVLDSVGGPAVAELTHHLRYGGKVVTYGALGGQRTEIEIRRDLIYRDLSQHGFWMTTG
jgi:NADPH:quinone reductase-like Zn-dependent oxidoreductase